MLAVLVLLLLAASDCGGRAGPEVPDGGFFDRHTFTNEHGSRDYLLYVPGGVEDQRVPLVVMLHGCGQDAEDFAAGTLMNAIAEREKFLVLYLEQDPEANRLRCWNWFEPTHQRRDSGEPSIIAGVTEQVTAEHDIDPDRVYVAGMSAGGSMTSIMGAAYPDLYAAIGVHSGLQYGAADSSLAALAAQQRGGPNPDRQGREAFLQARPEARVVPVIVFHGEEDRVVDVVNAHQTLSQWAQTNDYAHDGSDNDSITDEPSSVLRSPEPETYDHVRYVYEDPGGRTIMEKWIVEELGHAWSGGDDDGTHTDPGGPDASGEMIRFFAQTPRAFGGNS